MTQPTFVYFIAPVGGGLIKIGCSKYPINRVNQLARWSPVLLELCAFAPGNLQDEYAVQAAFIDQLSHKEWFRPSEELLNLINDTATAGVLPQRYRGVQPDSSRRIAGTKNPKPIKKRSPESFERGRLANLARIAREKKHRASLVTASDGRLA